MVVCPCISSIMLMQACESETKSHIMETAQGTTSKQLRGAKSSPSPLSGHRHPPRGAPACFEAAGYSPALPTTLQQLHAEEPLAWTPVHQQNRQSMHGQGGRRVASDAVQAQPKDSPDPEASAPDQAQTGCFRTSAQELALPHSAAPGCGEGASRQHELLYQEPGAQQSTLQKGYCQSGEQRGGRDSSGLCSLPSIANLPKMSSQDCGLQVGDLVCTVRV